MLRPLLTLIAVPVLLSPFAATADIALTPVSKNALHFRLEVGTKPGRLVPGWLDESRGTRKGYDFAALDLNNDGVYETKQRFPTPKNPYTKRRDPLPMVTIEHEGAKWCFDLQHAIRRLSAVKQGKVETGFGWTVWKGKFQARFINAKGTLTTDPAKAPVIRIGHPLKFQTHIWTRGAKTTLRVRLLDAQGGTLRSAEYQTRTRTLSVRLRDDQALAMSEKAEYG